MNNIDSHDKVLVPPRNLVFVHLREQRSHARHRYAMIPWYKIIQKNIARREMEKCEDAVDNFVVEFADMRIG